MICILKNIELSNLKENPRRKRCHLKIQKTETIDCKGYLDDATKEIKEINGLNELLWT